MRNTIELSGLIINLITIANDSCWASLVDFSSDHFKTYEQNLSYYDIPRSSNNLYVITAFNYDSLCNLDKN